MWAYRKRALQDVRRWQDKGWLDAGAAAEIEADLASRSSRFGPVAILAVLGAVLIGFGAMSFVAANWQEMPRLARMALLLSGLWACYGASGVLAGRGMAQFANAAALAGTALFGASIMLIAQMFHIEGNPPDAVLMWALGTVFAGAVLSSTAALGFAMPLMVLWGSWEQIQTSDVYWWFLAGWAAVTIAYVWHKWRPGFHISAIALSSFIVSLGFTLGSGNSFDVVAMIGLAVAAAAAIPVWLTKTPSFDEQLSIAGYGAIVAFCGLFGMQFIEGLSGAHLAVIAALTLSLLVAAIYFAITFESRMILWLGYIGFSAETLALYFKTVVSLLHTSVFFVVAGLLVSALAWLAYALHARVHQMEAH